MDEKFESFALVELMGHTKICGKATEQKFGSASMLRVDVPAIGETPGFTKFVSINSIYAITPLQESDALKYAEILRAQPIQTWDFETMVDKKVHQLIQKGSLRLIPDVCDDDDDFPL